MCAANLDCRDTLPAPTFLNALDKYVCLRSSIFGRLFLSGSRAGENAAAVTACSDRLGSDLAFVSPIRADRVRV
jgi:hypothetical protein